MSVLDIILLACFIPAIVSGITKGFVGQIVTLVGIVAGGWAGFHFAGPVATLLGNPDSKVLYAVCFLVILVVACILVNLIGNLVTRLLKAASLGWANRLAGLILGIICTILLLGLLISIFENFNSQWNLIDPALYNASGVYTWIRDASALIFPHVKDLVNG